MRKVFAAVMPLIACGLLSLLTGCGGALPDDPPDNSGSNTNNPPPPPDNGGDLAPASIGNNTIHGTFLDPHDHVSTVHFHITTVGGATGNYTYEEENLPTNTGTYTWTKTGPNTAAIDTSNNGTLTFTYTARQSGTYEYVRPGYTETGTFTTDN